MMALFINIFILLKASHLEMKISGTLECCKTQGRTSKFFVGWWGGSRLRQFSWHLKHTGNFLPLSPDCLFLLNFVPSSDSWADLLSKEFWVPQTCFERGFQVHQVTAVLLTFMAALWRPLMQALFMHTLIRSEESIIRLLRFISKALIKA